MEQQRLFIFVFVAGLSVSMNLLGGNTSHAMDHDEAAAILEVEPNAPTEVINAAFNKKLSAFLPQIESRHPETLQAAEKLRQARRILITPDKKSEIQKRKEKILQNLFPTSYSLRLPFLNKFWSAAPEDFDLHNAEHMKALVQKAATNPQAALRVLVITKKDVTLQAGDERFVHNLPLFQKEFALQLGNYYLRPIARHSLLPRFEEILIEAWPRLNSDHKQNYLMALLLLNLPPGPEHLLLLSSLPELDPETRYLVNGILQSLLKKYGLSAQIEKALFVYLLPSKALKIILDSNHPLSAETQQNILERMQELNNTSFTRMAAEYFFSQQIFIEETTQILAILRDRKASETDLLSRVDGTMATLTLLEYAAIIAPEQTEASTRAIVSTIEAGDEMSVYPIAIWAKTLLKKDAAIVPQIIVNKLLIAGEQHNLRWTRNVHQRITLEVIEEIKDLLEDTNNFCEQILQ